MNTKYRMHQVRIGVDESKSDLPKKILKKLGNRDYILTDVEIIKESIDARDKKNIKLVYTVDFRVVRRQRPKDYISIPLNPRLHIEEGWERKPPWP